MSVYARITALVSRACAINRPLAVASLLMLAAFIAAVAGLWLDPRTIAGAPAWLKPAKFGLSTAIYGFTLLWVFTAIPTWTRTRTHVGGITAAVFVGEVAIIAVQAWRGTTSHFNVGTPLDAVLFSAMGAGILLQTLASVAVAAALWRQRMNDHALGWALRLGMTITILGGASGGLMTAPTASQLDQARQTQAMPVAGAHTVGAADGGAGLPGTGWSTEHGDLRVPHFVGLHAVQVLPLLLLAMPRRWADTARARVITVAAASYVSLFALLLWQALRGESLVALSSPTASALAVWATATIVAAALASRPRRHTTPHAPRSFPAAGAVGSLTKGRS